MLVGVMRAQKTSCWTPYSKDQKSLNEHRSPALHGQKETGRMFGVGVGVGVGERERGEEVLW